MHGNRTSCSTVGRKVSAFVDGRLPEREWQEVRTHLSACLACATEAEEMIQVRASLRQLPQRPVPAQISMRLRVIASRERVRAERGRGVFARARHLVDRIDLFFHNLMRPLAIPAVGGLLSTVVLFGAMLPTFATHRAPGADTPLNDALFTEATVRAVLPVSFTDDNIAVDVLIDESGRMIDYSFPDGQSARDPELVRKLENMLLFTVYKPATSFGQPTSTRIRLTFQRERMDVKG